MSSNGGEETKIIKEFKQKNNMKVNRMDRMKRTLNKEEAME